MNVAIIVKEEEEEEEEGSMQRIFSPFLFFNNWQSLKYVAFTANILQYIFSLGFQRNQCSDQKRKTEYHRLHTLPGTTVTNQENQDEQKCK